MQRGSSNCTTALPVPDLFTIAGTIGYFSQAILAAIDRIHGLWQAILESLQGRRKKAALAVQRLLGCGLTG